MRRSSVKGDVKVAVQPARILVRGPNPIGDLVMATPSFGDIRRSFPAAHITLMVRPGRDGVVRGGDYFDELIVDRSKGGLGHALRLAGELRRRRFDLAILYTNSFRTAAVVALARIPERVGHVKGGQELLLTRRVPPVLASRGKWLPMAMETIYSRLCAAVGVVASDGWPHLVVTDDEEERAVARKVQLGIGVDEPLIGLAPGASFGGSKLWPVPNFAALADRLTDHYGWRTIIFGGPGEEAIVTALAAAMRTTPAAVGEPGELDLMKPFVRDLRLLITTDAGPRHLASAFRVPAVAVLGPTDPRWSGGHVDYQEVVRHEVDCGPCHLQVCPIDHHCMVDITAHEVMMRVAALERRCGPF